MTVGCVAASALMLAASVGIRAMSQGGPPQTPPPQTGTPPAGQGAGGQGAGGQRGRGSATFPAQQRAQADPDVIARGKGLYGTNCRSCHGIDLRGGDHNGPNLLRSEVALNDLDGESIMPVVLGSRAAQGMDPIDLPEADIKAIAAYIRSVLAQGRGQGAPPPGPPVVLNVLVGDAAAGQQYFAAHCSSCHSVTGNLQGIGARITDAMQLQNFWVSGGSTGGGRGGGNRGGGAPAAGDAPANPRQVTVAVTMPSGQVVEGRLGRIDDFIVTLTMADGTPRSFQRDGDIPKVVINDPLAPHRQLLPTYTDTDIHNVTAYLATIK